MNTSFKPFLDQIEQLKTKLNDPALRTKVLENLEKTRATVESKARVALKEAKDSKFMNEYVMPIVESEKTEQAIKKFGEKLGNTELSSKIESYRQALIDSKVSAAKTARPVESVAQEESATGTATAASATTNAAPTETATTTATSMNAAAESATTTIATDENAAATATDEVEAAAKTTKRSRSTAKAQDL